MSGTEPGAPTLPVMPTPAPTINWHPAGPARDSAAPSSSGSRRPARAGTTLVELIVALVIVTVGLLALAGAAAVVARETAAGRRESALAWRARARLERLTSLPCTLLSGGSTTSDGVAERWTVSAGRNGLRRLVVTVEAPASGGAARTVRRLEGFVACA